MVELLSQSWWFSLLPKVDGFVSFPKLMELELDLELDLERKLELELELEYFPKLMV